VENDDDYLYSPVPVMEADEKAREISFSDETIFVSEDLAFSVANFD